ncbi:MAG TPA: hypothetical protein VNC18_21365 [Gemmatimonadaceae bacterium]|jgi:hypothetical protein|nr:hypothetical protein [Gemmatimonadaceae bacterium]
MRLLCSLLLLAAPLANAVAGCKKDTLSTGPAPAPRTLFSSMRVAALHLDENGGSAIMNGRSQQIIEARIAIAFCRWPSYTLSAIGGSHMDSPTTSYLASGSETFHPGLHADWGGFELQKRWRDSSILHPMVSVAFGGLTTSYQYTHRETSGAVEYRTEGESTATYFAPAAGVEVSLFKYMTSYLLLGVRQVGALDTPAVERGGFNGQYVAFGFGFGKFR